MIVAAIIQARLGSTRLPAKVLLTLRTGRTVLEEVLLRAKQIAGVDVVVCAIPAGDEELCYAAERAGVVIVRGSPSDLLDRYYRAALDVNAGTVLRITADCPLLDPLLCSAVLMKLKAEGADYASNVMPRSFPRGLDCEAFTFDLLQRAHAEATDAYDREHTTPWMQRNAAIKHAGVYNADGNTSDVRLTLDTLDDFRAIDRELANAA